MLRLMSCLKRAGVWSAAVSALVAVISLAIAIHSIGSNVRKENVHYGVDGDQFNAGLIERLGELEIEN